MLVKQPEACIGAEQQKDILIKRFIDFLKIIFGDQTPKLSRTSASLPALYTITVIRSSLLKGLQALISINR